MTRISQLLAAGSIIIAVALSGCAGDGDGITTTSVPLTTPSGSPTTKTTAPPGQTVNTIVNVSSSNNELVPLQVGEKAGIQIAENPSTGYVWTLAKTPVGLQLIGQDVLQGQGDTVGAGADAVFYFLATAPGNTSIQLQLMSPAQKVQKTKTVKFIITPKLG